jgi:hypothetical protein
MVNDGESFKGWLGLMRHDPAVLRQTRVGHDIDPLICAGGRNDNRFSERDDPVRLTADGVGQRPLAVIAPLSTHFAMIAISAALNERSLLNFWMPTVRSIVHGGMVRATTFCLIDRAHGRASS